MRRVTYLLLVTTLVLFSCSNSSSQKAENSDIKKTHIYATAQMDLIILCQKYSKLIASILKEKGDSLTIHEKEQLITIKNFLDGKENQPYRVLDAVIFMEKLQDKSKTRIFSNKEIKQLKSLIKKLAQYNQATIT